jgi:FMNH2-dependent dimethyl sulfone monooxygenase
MNDAASVPQRANNALFNSSKLKLGLFSLNADGGIIITTVPERWRFSDNAGQIVTTTHVDCRKTDREAEDYYQHYPVDCADNEALDYHTNMARRNRQVDTAEIFNERKRYAAGLGSHPLIGSPERAARELAGLSAAGIDAVTLSFVNFKQELPFFIERVVALLRRAGLRQ